MSLPMGTNQMKLLLVCTAICISSVHSQSNYATHGNNVGYLGEGLPEEATLDGKVIILKIYLFKKIILIMTNCALGH